MSTGVELGVPMPCFSTALAFYDGYRSEMLPANLLQAQRVSGSTPNTRLRELRITQPFTFQDYFGAHTYELLSNPGKFVHTNWTGTGGNVSSTTYDA